MVTRCASYLRGRRLRATLLDSCGAPVFGEESVVTSSGFVSVAYTANVDEGEEVDQRNANNERCVYAPAIPAFLGYTAEITFCNVDPDLFSMLTGQETIVDANGDVIGFSMDTAISAADVNFALEVWAGTPPSDACSPAATGGSYGYILLPFVQGGIVGDFTIENDVVTFTITNATTKDGNTWGVGPYDVVAGLAGAPSPLPEALTSTKHLVLLNTSIAPPDAECGFRPLLDPEDAAITDVTTTPTLLSVVFAPVPAGSDPWWIDFGDGEWDYEAAGTNITHVYAAAGTYTYTAYRGSSSITDTVTVVAA